MGVGSGAKSAKGGVPYLARFRTLVLQYGSRCCAESQRKRRWWVQGGVSSWVIVATHCHEGRNVLDSRARWANRLTSALTWLPKKKGSLLFA